MFRQLIAYRFGAIDDRRAIDLATGLPVRLIVEEIGDAGAQHRWVVRCDALHALRHRALVPLIDYGVIGRHQRFEAWSGDAVASVGAPLSRAAVLRATTFLRACGLSAPDAFTADRVCSGPYGPRWLPDAETGHPIAPREHRVGGIADVDDLGYEPIVRRGRAAILDLFEATLPARTRAVALWGARGAGRRTLIAQAARDARLAGYVPVHRSIAPIVEPLIGGLPRLIIDDDADGGGWVALVGAAVRVPRPHVLLLVSDREVDGVDNVALEPVPVDRLIASIRPPHLSAALVDRVRRAAERACGLPARFAAALWGPATGETNRRDAGAVRG